MTTTYYPTIRAARNALALDTGFDPFTLPRGQGGWGQATKARLAEAGYPVDPARCRELAAEKARRLAAASCEICGAPSLSTVLDHSHGLDDCGRCLREYTGRCRAHTEYPWQCDNGHHWTSTEADYHPCPTCGEHAV